MKERGVTNIVFVGLGGQGVLRAADIVADVMFHRGFDVKKAEVHGMSQRGGVVTSDVRFGATISSPMVPAGEADFVVLADRAGLDRASAVLRPEVGRLVTPGDVDLARLPNLRCLNVALLGVLSQSLPGSVEAWEAAICRAFRPQLHEVNVVAFHLGRLSADLPAVSGL
jgi:indolepyruvate ferredoxin oxidoreductase beta subunit